MTFNTYNQYIAAPASEKIVLVHMHGVRRLYNLTLDGTHYSRSVPHFVVGVEQGTTGITLTSVTSLAALTDNTKFFYDISTSKLYLYEYDNDVDEVIATYRFFYSNAPISLSWDLQDNSPQVSYSPRVDTTPNFKSQMVQGKKGIGLMGSGDIVLANNDKYLNSIFDTIVWDNKDVQVYATHRDLKPSQAKIIFRGIIAGKTFSTDKITFPVKDNLYSLQSLIPLNRYGDLTRNADKLFFKRRIYGRVDNVLCQSIDQVGDGYDLTGTMSGAFDEKNVYGVGTSFLAEVSPDDELIFNGFEVTVEDVVSNTMLLVSKLKGSFSDLNAKIIPDKHYRNKNRVFQISDHAIKRYSTTVTEIISRNRIKVADTNGLAAGDIVTVAGETKNIRRISGDTIVLQTNYNLVLNIGDPVTKTEVRDIRYGSNEIPIAGYNVTIDNNVGGATISITDTAEYDASDEKTLRHSIRFVNGRSKVWLGSPTFQDITCVGSTKTGTGPGDYSLMGKYFILRDEQDYQVGFWFKDSESASKTSVVKPAAIVALDSVDGSSVKAITLESRVYSSGEIAELVANAIVSEIGAFSFYLQTNIIKLETEDAIDIIAGVAGTSGFTVNKTVQGFTPPNQVDMTDILSVRDFIKADGQSPSDYIEILKVDEKSITLRSPFQGSSQYSRMNYKNVEYIQDDTEVYVNTYGKTKDGTPLGEAILTVPEVVEDILKDIGMSAYIDNTSFISSKERALELVSLSLPLDFRATSAPTAKSVIDLLNQSVIGSLHVTNGLDLGYDVLDANFSSIDTISDSDIISYTVSDDAFGLSATSIGQYRHIDYDPKLDDKNFSQVTFESDFVNKYTKSTVTDTSDLYLYHTAEALELTERNQYLNSLSTSLIKIKGSLNLAKYQIADRVILDLSGLYTPYGSDSTNRRIAIVSARVDSGEKINLDLIDLGSILTRSAQINPDDATSWANTPEYKRIEGSYVVGDNGIVDDDESSAGTQLIS